jgi:hypothetical protein
MTEMSSSSEFHAKLDQSWRTDRPSCSHNQGCVNVVAAGTRVPIRRHIFPRYCAAYRSRPISQTPKLPAFIPRKAEILPMRNTHPPLPPAEWPPGAPSAGPRPPARGSRRTARPTGAPRATAVRKGVAGASRRHCGIDP